MNIYGLGHPRSGNTWVEYICGYFGVSNYIKAHGGASFPGHRGIKNWNKDYWMIFMIRDYKEAILRHQLFEEEATPEKVAEIALNKEYAEGIEVYDSWPNKKMHIYYEDLISEPSSIICELANFVECEKAVYETFMTNYEKHKNNSINLYSSSLGPSVTGGTKKDYHKFRLSYEDRVESDRLVREGTPVLYEKYLTRYTTKKENQHA
jgi:hypothetical protein